MGTSLSGPLAAGLLAAIESGLDWQAIAAIAAIAALLGKWIGGKIDAVGEHLEDQDDTLAALGQRVARLEGYERLNRHESLERLAEHRRQFRRRREDDD